MRLSGKIPAQKIAAAQELAKDIGTHKVVAVADLVKVRSSQVQETRRKLRGKVKVLVTKNMLFKKAAESLEEEKKEVINFANSVTGPSLFLFTEMDPFALAILLDKSKVKVAAKVGDKATSEILVPAGNTGLPPGPIISEFGESKVPTKIESGSIWVTKDTIVARKGGEISAKLASVLSKLGIKPIEAGISLKAAYENGFIFSGEDLHIDLNSYSNDVAFAAKQALGLAVEVNYLTVETAPVILSKVQREAIWLAVKSGYPASIAMPELLRETFLGMKALAQKISLINKEAAPTSYEAPAPAQVVSLKLEETTVEMEAPKEEKPPKTQVAPAPALPPTPTAPKIEAPVRKTRPVEKRPPEPAKEIPAKMAAEEAEHAPPTPTRKKTRTVLKEPKPRTKKAAKEKVEKKEKAKKGKAKSK